MNDQSIAVATRIVRGGDCKWEKRDGSRIHEWWLNGGEQMWVCSTCFAAIACKRGVNPNFYPRRTPPKDVARLIGIGFPLE